MKNLFFRENAAKKPKSGRKKREKRRIIIISVLAVLAAVIIAGLVLVSIPPKVAVTEISVIPAETFFPFSDEDIKPVDDDSPNGVVLYTSDTASEYYVAVINMTVTGRSVWNGRVSLILLDECDNRNQTIQRTLDFHDCEIGRFNSKGNCDIQLLVHSAGNDEEEIASVLKSVRIELCYTNPFHSLDDDRLGIVYASCKKAKINFENR